MVLFKRKPVLFPEPQPLPDNTNVRCWYIRQTKEWFLDYEEYLKRLDYYKTRKFVCEITGNSCLTFFDAYESEQKEMKLVESNFPEHLKEPILRHIQFSTTPRIDQLVDEVYSAFKNDYYPGETVMIRLNDYRNDYKTRCIIREKAKFNAIYDAENNPVRPAYSQYRVSRVDTGFEVVVEGTQITRDRNNFTKWFVKTFIKLTVTRSPKIGAPWIVKKRYAEAYRIPTELPQHLAHFKDYTPAKSHKKQLLSLHPKSEPGSKGSRKATPDLKRAGTKNVLILPRTAQPSAPQAPPPPKRTVKEDLENPFEMTSRKPMPHQLKELGDYVADALESWTFLNVYREPLILDTFTFDDFLTAMRWSSHHRCTLLDEIFCAVLSGFVKQGAKQLDGFIPEDPQDFYDQETSTEVKSEVSNSTIKTENGISDDQTEQQKATEDSENKYDQEEEDTYDETDRVDEYVTYRNQSYIDRLAKRNFKDGGWQIILLGILDEVRHHREWRDHIKIIFEELAPLDAGVSATGLLGRFSDMEPGLRIKALNILCSLLVNAPMIRQHIDKCMEDATALRRERLEKIREYKVSYEKAQDIDKELREIYDSTKHTSNVPNPSTADQSNPDKPQQEHETKKKRRRAGIKVEPTEFEMKFAQENEQFAAILASRTAQLKLGEDIRAQRKSLERQIVEIDIQRIKYLGKDRLFNRYWWFENNGLPNLGGGKRTDEDEDEVDEDDEEDDDEDLHSETYLMGRLWVQGPNDEDVLHVLNLKQDMVKAWRKLSNNDDEDEEEDEKEAEDAVKNETTVVNANGKTADDTNDENETQDEIKPTILKEIPVSFIKNAEELFNIKFDGHERKIKSVPEGNLLVDEYGATATDMTPIQRKIIEEHPDPLLSSSDWRYYDQADEIERLLKWFDQYGARESKLGKELGSVKDRIISSIAARRKALKLDSKTEEEEELLASINETVISDTEPESEDNEDDEDLNDIDVSGSSDSDVEQTRELEVRRTRRSIAEAEKVAHERQKKEHTLKQKEAELEARRERARPAKRVARRELKKRKIKEHKQKRSLIASSKVRLEELQEEKEAQRCQEWVNSNAIEKLGHTHYDGPRKTKTRVRR